MDYLSCAKLSVEIGNYDGAREYLAQIEDWTVLLDLVADSDPGGPNMLEACAYETLIVHGITPSYISNYVIDNFYEGKYDEYDETEELTEDHPNDPFDTESAWNSMRKSEGL